MCKTFLLIVPYLVLLTGCASSTQTIPREWLSVPESPRIRSVALAADGSVTTGSVPGRDPLKDGAFAVVSDFTGARVSNGTKRLTDPFEAIDSLDFDEGRREVVFSARREGNFDIGLVAEEGSPISWVPSDPADEVAVQWAPRGNKISYVIRARGGDIVRTLHVPTSYEFAIPFENGRVHAVGWDPQAERYAVGWSSLEASDRVDVLEYDGDSRREAVPPAARIDAEIESYGPDAVLLRPRDLRYEEKVPLVVWIAGELDWSDERAALLKNARVALLVVKRYPDQSAWERITATPWIDAGRQFLVEAVPGALSGQPARGIVISGDASIGAGRYRRKGSAVAVPPAVVQSVAAAFIADELKRTTPTNGSSR